MTMRTLYKFSSKKTNPKKRLVTSQLNSRKGSDIKSLLIENIYRKISIDRPGDIRFFSTHNFWTTCHRTKIKTYSERVKTFLSKYALIIVLWQVVQKLCVEKSGYPLVYLSSIYGTVFSSQKIFQKRLYVFSISFHLIS